MASAATIASSAAVVKEFYPKGEVPWSIYKKYPGFLWAEKDEEFVGQPARVAVQTETTNGASATFANAQTNLAASSFYAFLVTRVSDYSIARIDNQALAAVDGDEGGLVDLWKREMDGAMRTAMLALEVQMWRKGTGTRGVVGALAGTLLTLATPTDVVGFSVLMTVGTAHTDGGATTAGVVVITGMDRVAGTLTAAVAWTTTIAGLIVGDFIFRDGDNANGGANLVITGLGGWLPGGSTPGSLFGVNRNIDPLALAGRNYNAAGVSCEEAAIQALAFVGVEMGEPTDLWVHPTQRAALIKSFETKRRFTGPVGGEVGAGGKSIKIATPDGEIEVRESPMIPFGQAFLLEKENIKIGSTSKCPAIQDFDDLKYLRVSNQDQLEVRIFSYLQLYCRSPRTQVQISNFGQ